MERSRRRRKLLSLHNLFGSHLHGAPERLGSADDGHAHGTTTSTGAPPVSASADVTLTVATVPHTLSVTVSGGLRSRWASQGSTNLARSRQILGTTALLGRGPNHSAGGTFRPRRPSRRRLIGAANISGQAVTVTLTATATSDGSPPPVASADMALTVASVPHTLTVTASGDPLSVASAGSTNLSATATDSLGHGFTWAWSDHGAGGSLPSTTVAAPTYTAPANASGQSMTITLTATATSDGSPPPPGAPMSH